MSRIGRVSQNYHDGQVPLDFGRGVDFIRNGAHGTPKRLDLALRLFERVGQIDAKPLVAIEFVCPRRPVVFGHVEGGELHPKFEMRQSVSRHYQLESKQPLYKMLFDVSPPHARVAARAVVLPDMLYDGVQKRARPAGGVENQHAMRGRFPNRDSLFAFDFDRVGRHRAVGEPFRASEIVAQDAVHGANNIAYDRFGRVINPAPLPEIGVVSGEKPLVEVHDWVLSRRAPPKAAQYGFHIRVV